MMLMVMMPMMVRVMIIAMMNMLMTKDDDDLFKYMYVSTIDISTPNLGEAAEIIKRWNTSSLRRF